MNVKISAGSQSALAAAGWAGQTVQGRVVEQTGHFFILCARVSVYCGEDLVSSWAGSQAELMEVRAQEGTTLNLILGATGQIWSSQGVAQGETSEATNDIPQWFKSGRIGFERQNIVFDPRVPIWAYSETSLRFSEPPV